MTNRHVAATWETKSTGNYIFSQLKRAYIVVCNNEACTKSSVVNEPLEDQPRLLKDVWDWVPSKARALNGKRLSGRLEGRNDRLKVTFPGTKLRVPARLVRVSDSADVALIKIDLPQAAKAVPLGAEDPVEPGDPVTVMGYPGVSPDVFVQIKSQDPMNPEPELRTIPEPTVTGGNIGKVIRGNAPELSESISGYYSEMGDVYQLTINATGSGNSGGPVFNAEGRVIGIFTYSKTDRSDTKITFAVPIKHGLEIMGVQRVFD